MAPKKDVHEFAVKWFEKYRSPKTKEYEVEEGFSEECFSLGFEMDCGKDLLGSAIFSQWRYVTHRSETGLLKLRLSRRLSSAIQWTV